MATILERLRGTATPAIKANRAQAVEAQSIYATNVSPRYRDFHSYLAAYKHVPWVRACVSVIAFNAANIKYELVQPGDGDQEDKVIQGSPLLALLKQPNPYENGFSFFERIWTDLELCGNAFVSMEEQDGRGRPSELYRLSPDCVTVVPDAINRIAGYHFTVNGKTVNYMADEVWHLMYPNPIDEYYGMGVIEANETRADSQQAMAEHERNFWRSGAKITGILQTDTEVDDTVFARVASTFKRFITGSGYTTAILEAGLKYQPVSDGPAKLGLIEMSRMGRDEILAMFGVPPTKVGILENANYKAQSSDEYFWTEVIDPKLTRMEQAKQLLVERFHPGQGLNIRYQRVNVVDDRPMADVSKILQDSHVRTINELRAYQGAPPFTNGGDDILISSGREVVLYNPETGDATVLAATGSGQDTPQNNPALPVAGDTRVPLAMTQAKTRTSTDRPATAFRVLQLRDEALAHADDTHIPALDVFFTSQLERVKAKLTRYRKAKAALTADSLWDTEDENATLTAYLQSIHMDAITAGYEAANAVGLDVAFNLHNPRLEAFMGELATRVTGINETTKIGIDEQVNEGLRRGYSVDQIARGVPAEQYKGISGVFAEATGYRARMIARTETAVAYNGASVMAYGESGRVKSVELLDGVGDAQCARRNGQIIPLDQAMMLRDHPNGTLAMAPVVIAS